MFADVALCTLGALDMYMVDFHEAARTYHMCPHCTRASLRRTEACIVCSYMRHNLRSPFRMVEIVLTSSSVDCWQAGLSFLVFQAPR